MELKMFLVLGVLGVVWRLWGSSGHPGLDTRAQGHCAQDKSWRKAGEKLGKGRVGRAAVGTERWDKIFNFLHELLVGYPAGHILCPRLIMESLPGLGWEGP